MQILCHDFQNIGGRLPQVVLVFDTFQHLHTQISWQTLNKYWDHHCIVWSIICQILGIVRSSGAWPTIFHRWQIASVCQPPVQRRRRRRHAFKLQQMVLTIFAPASVFSRTFKHYLRVAFPCISLLQMKLGPMWLTRRGISSNQLNQITFKRSDGEAMEHVGKAGKPWKTWENQGKTFSFLWKPWKQYLKKKTWKEETLVGNLLSGFTSASRWNSNPRYHIFSTFNI